MFFLSSRRETRRHRAAASFADVSGLGVPERSATCLKLQHCGERLTLCRHSLTVRSGHSTDLPQKANTHTLRALPHGGREGAKQKDPDKRRSPSVKSEDNQYLTPIGHLNISTALWKSQHFF